MPHRVLRGFSLPFSLILFNSEGNRNRISRRVKFWIERLIINSAGELSFSGISFGPLFMLMYIETRSFHRQHTQAPADSSPPSPKAPSRLACFQLLPPSPLLHSAALLPYAALGTLLTYIMPSLLSYNILPHFLAAFPSSAWESPLLPDQDLTTNLRFLLPSHSQVWPWEAGQRDDLLRDPQYQHTPFSFSDSPLPALGGLYFWGRRSLLNQRRVKI